MATATTKAPTKKAPAKKAGSDAKTESVAGTGRIARVTGPVVDIEFPHDAIPDIYNALKTTITLDGVDNEITLEVAQHLGDDVIRAIALKPTDGLVRGRRIAGTHAAQCGKSMPGARPCRNCAYDHGYRVGGERRCVEGSARGAWRVAP